jgi:hypothetical protein
MMKELDTGQDAQRNEMESTQKGERKLDSYADEGLARE